MSRQTTTHENYYVPAQSKWPIVGTLALLTTVFGLGSWFNDLKAGRDEISGPIIFFIGALLIAYMMFGWFGAVVREGRAGLYSAQMDRSFRWGMSWFIFSEVMFFLAFFGVLFYIRYWVGPWLDGEGDKGVSAMLWPNFEYSWPLLNNPDPGVYPAPEGTISPWGLPLINTILLVTSSFTLTWAHHALIANKRSQLIWGLALTVLLGAIFMGFQAYEYIHAYRDLNLKLTSGIFGSTFFMLTGFHGFHVTIGAIMLFFIMIRCIKGHFTPDSHFAFEAAAWYWHFVDVVWLGLYVVVYWL